MSTLLRRRMMANNGDNVDWESLAKMMIEDNAIVSIEIPEGITALRNKLFNGMSSLQSITLPSTIRTIGDNVFDDCTGLTSIDLTNVTTLGTRCLRNTGIVSLTLPQSITSIGINALIANRYMTTLIVNATITSLPAEFCYNMPLLATVILNSQITSTNPYAFHNCPSLKTLTLPSSLTRISGNLLTGTTVPDELIFESTTPPTIEQKSTALGSTSNTFPIYVPHASVTDYKNDSSWVNYASRVKSINERT